MPRYAGSSTFVRLPELRDVERCDVAILGAPFDGGVSFRPGARFGPMAIRQASRAIRPQYHPEFDVQPFANLQFADAGDVACNPYSIAESLAAIEARASELLGPAAGPHPVDGLLTIGGDHTDRVHAAQGNAPPIRKGRLGPLRRPPRHLGHLLRRAVHPWNAISTCCRGRPVRHGGVDARRHSRPDLLAVRLRQRRCAGLLDDQLRRPAATRCRRGRSADPCSRRRRPLYLSIDIDVLDPAHAPGTGTPEIAGMTSRELVMILRGLAGMNLVSGDVVEVAPAYDHAEITSLAAATTVYELACLMAVRGAARTPASPRRGMPCELRRCGPVLSPAPRG